MNQLRECYFEKNKIRILFINSEPWWIAKDICESLGYVWHHNLLSHVPEQWKGSNPITTKGGKQTLLCLSEAGLFFFLNRSDKPKALPFQMWIAGEVLPNIRRTGQYSLPSLPHGVILQDSGFEYIPPLSERISSLESSVSDIKEAINSIAFTGSKIEGLHREYQNKPHSKKHGNCRVKCSFQDVYRVKCSFQDVYRVKCSFQDVYRVEWLTGMWLSALGASITEKEVVTLAIDSLIEKLKLELKGEKPSFALQRTTIPVNPLRIPYDR